MNLSAGNPRCAAQRPNRTRIFIGKLSRTLRAAADESLFFGAAGVGR